MPTEPPELLLRRVLSRLGTEGDSSEALLGVAIEELGRHLCASEGWAHLVDSEGQGLIPLPGGNRWRFLPDGRTLKGSGPVRPGSSDGEPGARPLVVRRATLVSHPTRRGPAGETVALHQHGAPDGSDTSTGYALLVPLLSGSGITGLLEFHFEPPSEPHSERLLEVDAVGRMVGEALSRRRVQEELEGATARLAALLPSESHPVEGETDAPTLSGHAPRQGTAPSTGPALSMRADRDPLTGLANRDRFRKRLLRAIERREKRPDHRFAVLFLDLDRFKDVNDAFGHLLGDELLVLVADRLEESVRPGDVLARYGGDEFVILLEDVGGTQDVLAVADRIAARLAQPFPLDGQEVTLAASVGIALSETGYGTVEDLLRDADSAMYRAKEEGGARYRIFDRALSEEVAQQGRIRSELQFSLDRGEFSLHYQPVLNLTSRRITGVEALLRWQHPERGLIPATEFISEAEAMKLILPLGRWVIEEGCRQLRSWQDRFGNELPLTLSLNLSVRELVDRRLHDWLRESIEASGVRPSSLRIEVAESFFARPMAEVDAALRPLQELGVQIGVDDFGRGPFSLTRLGRAPVDFLKIDRRLVGSLLDENGHDERIVRGILALAAGLGLDVVAPGVETGPQEALLRELACPTAQGFYFSKPVDAERAETLHRRGRVGDDG